MSVQYLHPPHPDLDWLNDQLVKQPCYYCAGVLESPFLVWMGAGEALTLHPACTVELTIRLLRDVHQVECQSHRDITDPLTPAEGLRLRLRERLRKEEGLT